MRGWVGVEAAGAPAVERSLRNWKRANEVRVGQGGGGAGRVRVWGGGGRGGAEGTALFNAREPEFTFLLRTRRGPLGILPSI